MILNKLKFLLALTAPLLFVIFFSAQTVHASVINFTSQPPFPGPNSNVTLIADTYVVDFEISEVYWYINEQLIDTGVGLRQFSFSTSDLGEPTVIDIVVVTPQGYRLTERKVINPIDVPLIWEADTYTPPFYRGKALPSAKSEVKIVALPQVAESDISFVTTWKEKGFIRKDASGLNRLSFVTQASLDLIPVNINIQMESLNKSYTFAGSLQVTARPTELHLYPATVLGTVLYDRAAQTPVLFEDNPSISLVAEPFFVSQEDHIRGDIQFEWDAGLESTQATTRKSITFLRPTEGKGSTLIELTASNKNNFHQRMTEILSLNY